MNRIAKHSTRAALVALAAALLQPAALQAADKKYQKIKAPQLREVVVPPVTRVTLDNGLNLFVVEDHDLPLFRMQLIVKAGGADEPADKTGLAAITADVLRSGGSEKLPGDRMDETLESMGGSIETSSDALTTTVSVNVLIEDTDRVLAMLRDLLVQPAFPQDKIDLSIKQVQSLIARRNDDPGGIAQREFDKVLFGSAHPFARQIEYEHLARIGRQDLIDFHAKYYHPQDAYLAVWGDFTADEIVAKLRQVLGEWPSVTVTHAEFPPVPETQPSVNLCVKESVNQSTIWIGHRGTTQKDPDYYALVVMNEILGGSFGSRLFNEVRSRLGLSYSVGSALGAGLTHPGMFRVTCGTKSETTLKAARACIEEVRKMKTEAITPDELQRAKEGILNSHVFNFTNTGAIVTRQMSYVRNGYPADFLEKFPQGIQAVTIEDVKRAAGKYLQPERFAVLVVGKPDDFDESLAALGAVNTIDITIPEPAVAEEYPAPTPETLAQGKEVLAQAAAAMGGASNLAKLTDVTESCTLTLTMMGQSIPGKLTKYVQYPGNTRSEIEVMGQKIVQAFSASANSGFKSMGGKSQGMDAADLQDAREELARELVLAIRDAESYAPQWIGLGEVRGAPADIVLMSPPGAEKFKLFVDRTTHRVVKQEYRGKSFQGTPVREEVFLDDYRKVGAVVLPHKSEIKQDGETAISSETQQIGWDPIPADKFLKIES